MKSISDRQKNTTFVAKQYTQKDIIIFWTEQFLRLTINTTNVRANFFRRV